MPTMTQLPQVAAVDGEDLLLIEQSGTSAVASAAQLRAGLHPKISIAGTTVLGRLGPLIGPPEPIGIGGGLNIVGGQLQVDTSVIAPLDSPIFSGHPTAPTPSSGDSSNAIATTAFVQARSSATSVQLTGDVAGFGQTGAPISVALPAITTPGSYTKVSVNAKGLVVSGGTLSPADVSGLATVATSGSYADLANKPAAYTLPSVLPAIDISAGRVTSTLTGAVSRGLGEVRGEVIRVADLLGSKPDGLDATAAMVMALGLAANMPGSTVELCSGVWNFASLAGSLLVPSRTTIRGAGRHQTKITWNDTGGFVLFISTSDGVTRCADIVFAELTVAGTWAANGEGTAYPFVLGFVDGLQFRDVCVEYSRIMSIVARNCTEVQVRDCVVRYSARDGINLAQCASLTIDGCTVAHCDDDGIAVHSDVFDPWAARKNVVISNNRLFDCQGIKVLAPRGTAIIGNVVDCCRAQGIAINCQPADNAELEGVTSASTTLVAGNIVTNIINRQNIDNLNQNAPGIYISGASARAGSFGIIPGEAKNSTAKVIDPYPYFAVNSHLTTTATPGSFGIIVADNFIGRTLPACNGSVTTPKTFAHFSDYGFGLMFTRTGWINPALAESDLRDHAVWIAGGVVRDVLVCGNIIRGMTSGMALLQSTRLENIVFRDNQVVDCASYGVLINTTGTLRAYIESNVFDLDPFTKHANRGGNGTWLALGDPTGIKAQAGSGVYVRRNIFRNLCRDSDQASDAAGGAWLFEGNVLEADPTALGFSTANKGIGQLRAAAGTLLAQADSNPGSATFGQMQTMPSGAGTAMPSAGKWLAGHFVRNAQPALTTGLINLGWTRLTTGANNVLGTDWAQALAVGGNVAARLVLASATSGSAVPSFRALAAADIPSLTPLPAITTTYTASGAIAPTDNLALVNAAGAVAMTLAAGTVDGRPITIKRYGAGTVTLTANIDGVAGSQVIMNATTVKESASLAWSSSLATWLMI